MPRQRRPSKKSDPFGPIDLQLLDFIRSHDSISRATFCTFARRGTAFRESEPERAAKWIEQLSCHPFYKAGQFLFDLFEWEDFMLDGPPPPLVGEVEVFAVLKRITGLFSSIHGQPVDLETVLEPTNSPETPSLPPLESGFYLYRDVVLGALSYILQSGVTKQSIEPDGPEPSWPGG